VWQGILEKEAQSYDDEMEMEGVLNELASAFDPVCAFHTKNRDVEVTEAMEAAAKAMGMEFPVLAPWAEPISLNEELSTVPRAGSPSDEKQHCWLAFLFNLFAHFGGITAIRKVGSFSVGEG
jgi:hypothetical protein